jgi:hypothetical protein
MSAYQFLKLFESIERLTLYRGISQSSPRDGHYYTTDAEWALNFSQSGRELRSITVDNDLIYYDEPLPSATSESDISERLKLVEGEGDYIGFWVSEGVNQPDSVFLLSPEYADMFDLGSD